MSDKIYCIDCAFLNKDLTCNTKEKGKTVEVHITTSGCLRYIKKIELPLELPNWNAAQPTKITCSHCHWNLNMPSDENCVKCGRPIKKP